MAYDLIATHDYYHKRLNVVARNLPIGCACIRARAVGGGGGSDQGANNSW